MARQPRERLAERRKPQNLRADMSADAAPVDPAGIAILPIQRKRIFPVDAEFMAVMAGRDVRVPSGLYVGVRANSRWRAKAGARGSGGKDAELGCRLHVEHGSARVGAFGD